MNRIVLTNNKLFFLCLLFILCSLPSFGEEKPDALALFLQKKYTEAEKACLNELEETPKNLNSYVVLGWALLEQKKYLEAARYSELGFKIQRYDHRLIFTAAEAYYHLGENKKALKYLQEYAQIWDTSKKIKNIYYLMGEVYIRLGEYSNADMAFSTALHYDNKVADWWTRLGYAREMGKNYKWALEAYENALKIDPNNTDAKRGINKVKQFLR